MSDTNQEPGEDQGFDASATGDGFLSTFDVADELANFTTATSPEDLQVHLADRLAIEKPFMSAADYATWDAIDDAFFEAYSSGYLNPPQYPAFFNWLYYNQGISTIGLVGITSGALIGLIYAYAASHGNNTLGLEAALNPGQFTYPSFVPPPPAIAAPDPAVAPPSTSPQPWAPAAPVAFPNTPAPPSPNTPGGHIVKQALAGTTPVSITATGVSPEVAAAISAAIQAETSKITGIVASAIDEALGGLQPGHAKAQIASNAKNISALKTAVLNLQVSVTTDNTADIRTDLATITTEVDKLIAQLDLTEASALDTRVNTIGTELQTDFSELTTKVEKLISQMDLTVPSALDTRLNAVGDDATTALGMLALTIPSKLDSALNTVEHALPPIDNDIGKLQECCSENSAVTNPITEGGATPSLLKQLGGILLGASVLTAIVSTLGVVAAMFDGRLELAAIVSDTETVTNWVVDAIDGAPDSSTWLQTMAPVGG